MVWNILLMYWNTGLTYEGINIVYFCKHGDEFCLHKGREFLYQLSNCHLQKESAAWSRYLCWLTDSHYRKVCLLCYSACMINYWIFSRKALGVLTHTLRFLCILATDVKLIISNQWCLMLNRLFGLNTCLTPSTVCLNHKDNPGESSWIQGGTKDPWYLVPCIPQFSSKVSVIFVCL